LVQVVDEVWKRKTYVGRRIERRMSLGLRITASEAKRSRCIERPPKWYERKFVIDR